MPGYKILQMLIFFIVWFSAFKDFFNHIIQGNNASGRKRFLHHLRQILYSLNGYYLLRQQIHAAEILFIIRAEGDLIHLIGRLERSLYYLDSDSLRHAYFGDHEVSLVWLAAHVFRSYRAAYLHPCVLAFSL